MTEEIWRPVVGYEGLYEVSSYGRVRSLDRYDSRNHFIKGRIMKFRNCRGYLRVTLCNNGLYNQISVHRLVAQAFIPNPDNLPMVNHKDEDKTNNIVENLEWCDAKYNNSYGTITERRINSKIKTGFVDPDMVGLSKKDRYKKYQEKNKEKLREYQHQYYLKRKAGL